MTVQEFIARWVRSLGLDDLYLEVLPDSRQEGRVLSLTSGSLVEYQDNYSIDAFQIATIRSNYYTSLQDAQSVFELLPSPVYGENKNIVDENSVEYSLHFCNLEARHRPLFIGSSGNNQTYTSVLNYDFSQFWSASDMSDKIWSNLLFSGIIAHLKMN